MSFRFVENIALQSSFVPVDLQDGANTGDWFNAAHYDRFAVLVFKAAGTAGDDPTLTINQASDNAGTGSKGLNFTVIYSKVGTLTGTADWTVNTQAAANTYTDAASAESQAFFLIEFKAEELDVDNGFDHVQLTIADVGSNAQLGCAMYMGWGGRYPQATVPSTL